MNRKYLSLLRKKRFPSKKWRPKIVSPPKNESHPIKVFHPEISFPWKNCRSSKMRLAQKNYSTQKVSLPKKFYSEKWVFPENCIFIQKSVSPEKCVSPEKMFHLKNLTHQKKVFKGGRVWFFFSKIFIYIFFIAFDCLFLQEYSVKIWSLSEQNWRRYGHFS